MLSGPAGAGKTWTSLSMATRLAEDEDRPDSILVIDTETREQSAEEARERARAAGATLKAGSPRVLYKKVDSTLRGRVAAEIDGMLDGAGFGLALNVVVLAACAVTVWVLAAEVLLA